MELLGAVCLSARRDTFYLWNTVTVQMKEVELMTGMTAQSRVGEKQAHL